ncbi:hypothetical protein OO013_10065 [Mangrovivirga sp. M17]|uniref:DUF4382 domain-containing protein n=1 Tax=Mangrovivirga halotolerans TaxID=2993936 RepID=A0ABT3RR10_9BACT|nr:hypothetical protein [Mangrovivirga halotolerans]MCX2744212.1 hypothetical protein [Mangrovivirga halotolerans]
MTNTKLNFFGILAFASLLTFSSCDDEESTRPEDNKLIYEVYMDPQGTTLNSGRVAASEIIFTSGTLNLEEVDFEAESSNTEIEIESNRKTSINLITGESTPELPQVSLAEGIYDELELGLKLDGSSSNDAFILEGTFTDSENNSVPFKFLFNEYLEIELEAEGQFTFDGTGLVEIELFPYQWFSQIDPLAFESASRNQDGEIIISKDQNNALFQTISESFKTNVISNSEVKLEIEIED